MANEKRLIYLEDAIKKIVIFPSKAARDAFYSKKQFTPMQMLTVVADRQYEIIDLLKQVKEVDAVEVVHSEWTLVIDENDCECIECPMCGEQFYDGDNDTFDKPYNYCPNCGAKMDGGSDNE